MVARPLPVRESRRYGPAIATPFDQAPERFSRGWWGERAATAGMAFWEVQLVLLLTPWTTDDLSYKVALVTIFGIGIVPGLPFAVLWLRDALVARGRPARQARDIFPVGRWVLVGPLAYALIAAAFATVS